jgi:hypothetical protein
MRFAFAGDREPVWHNGIHLGRISAGQRKIGLPHPCAEGYDAEHLISAGNLKITVPQHDSRSPFASPLARSEAVA